MQVVASITNASARLSIRKEEGRKAECCGHERGVGSKNERRVLAQYSQVLGNSRCSCALPRISYKAYVLGRLPEPSVDSSRCVSDS